MPADPATSPSDILQALRAELDTVDDQLHDTLMRRAEIVTRIGALGGKGRTKLRPGREANILRRLLARHQGPLAKQAVVRLWREMFAASTAMQGPFAVAVCDGPEMLACAHEHFGALTALHACPTPAAALAALRTNAAALLPLPADGTDWWETLGTEHFIVGRLPVWPHRPAGSPAVQALVASANPPDSSGQDCSLLLVPLPEWRKPDWADRAAAAGFKPRPVAQGTTHALLEVDGFVSPDDKALAHIGARLAGAYPLPLTPNETEAA